MNAAAFNGYLPVIKIKLSTYCGQEILQTASYDHGNYAYFRFESEEAAKKAVRNITYLGITFRIKSARRVPALVGGNVGGIGNGGRRSSKRTRREGSNEEYDDDATTTASTATTTTIVGPSAEDLRRIMEESLAGHELSRVESRIAGLERDAANRDEMHGVLLSKYDASRLRVEVWEGSNDDMRRTLAEQRNMIEGYAMDIRPLEEEKRGVEERLKMEREKSVRERREMDVLKWNERNSYARGGRLAAAEATRVDMLNTLREKDKACLAVRGELNASEVEREKLSTRLSQTSSALDENKALARTLKLKVQQLSEEVRTANAKRVENEATLEEMAKKNEQLLARLDATESKMKLRLQEALNSADEQARVHAATVAEKDAFVEDLSSAQDTISNL